MQQLFINQFAANANINSGITIYVESFYDQPSDTQTGELIEYVILNHTNEDITFSNVGFGLRVFTIDETGGMWQEIFPVIHPDNTQTILMAKVEKYNPQANNSVYLEYSYFRGNLPIKLRILVNGIGKLSHTTYVAYIDLLRKIK